MIDWKSVSHQLLSDNSGLRSSLNSTRAECANAIEDMKTALMRMQNVYDSIGVIENAYKDGSKMFESNRKEEMGETDSR